MLINEIFYSLQGEGKLTGKPTTFIRTTGCNLRCSYCDTKYSYKTGNERDIEEIMTIIKKYPTNHICLTGGEPLIQKDINDLISTLLKNEYNISIETNGSQPIEYIINHDSVFLSLDIKCPSSNMHEKMIFNNLLLLKKDDQVKFIIQNKNDYIYAKKILKNYKIKCSIFLQPVWGTDPQCIANYILEDGLNVQLGIQLHKILWGNKKGV